MTKPAPVKPKKATPPPIKPEPVQDQMSAQVQQPGYMTGSGMSGANLNMSTVQNNQTFPLFLASASKAQSAPMSLGIPSYLNASASNQDPYYLPDAGGLTNTHQASLENLKPNADQSKTDNTIKTVSGTNGSVQFTEISVSAGGDEGSMQMHDTMVFDPTAAPADVVSQPKELNLPPEEGRTNPYPIQFYFKREISYADKKGRILHMEFIVTMGFSTQNWLEHAGLIIPNDKTNQWNRLRYMKADEASATFLIDGHGMTEDQYMAFSSADGSSIAFDDLWQALYGGRDMSDFDLILLLPPEAGAGQQFAALRGWLDRVDYARWKAAHPDKKWWQQGLSFIGGLGKSVYNNTVGAVIQAGLQLADMERLWTAIWLRKAGIVSDDYIPKMWSDMGKAAEEGQGTGDLLLGMGKGMVLAPYRFVKAVQHGDAGAAGEALGDTYFAVEGAKGLVEAAPGMYRAGVKGLGKIRNLPAVLPALGKGLRDFHTNLRARAIRFMAPGEFAGESGLRTMAGTSSPNGLSAFDPGANPGGGGGPRPPELQAMDAAHYQWIDQMHAATRGEGPGPAAWDGPAPELDAQGAWSGTNPAEAYAAYQEAVRSGGSQFEAIISRNRATGQYHVMLGNRRGVSVPRSNSAPSAWDTVLHYHPNLENAPRYTLAAQADVHQATLRGLQAPHPEGRPHIEFVESIIDGQPTRVAMVSRRGLPPEWVVEGMDMTAGVPGGPGNMNTGTGYFDFWRAQEYRPIDAGERYVVPSSPEYFQLMIDAAQFYDHRIGGTSELAESFRLEARQAGALPGERWVPSGSQTARRMMLDAAQDLGHDDIFQEIQNSAPEYSADAAMRTQSGVAPLDASAAPAKPTTQRELMAQSPAGSPYGSLNKLGPPTRFTTAIRDDQPATMENMQMVQSVEQLRGLLTSTRLAGGFTNNGGGLDPSQAMEGESYWLLLQTDKGQLWLVPSYLVEKAAAETLSGLKP